MEVRQWSVAPYFLVDDVQAAAAFYRDKLGFKFDRFWGEPPSFCMPHRNGVLIMLAETQPKGQMRPNAVASRDGGAWDAYIWVPDADILLAEFRASGVNITREICDQPYGCRDFDIQDCNGYTLCFGHNLNQES